MHASLSHPVIISLVEWLGGQGAIRAVTPYCDTYTTVQVDGATQLRQMFTFSNNEEDEEVKVDNIQKETKLSQVKQQSKNKSENKKKEVGNKEKSKEQKKKVKQSSSNETDQKIQSTEIEIKSNQQQDNTQSVTEKNQNNNNKINDQNQNQLEQKYSQTETTKENKTLIKEQPSIIINEKSTLNENKQKQQQKQSKQNDSHKNVQIANPLLNESKHAPIIPSIQLPQEEIELKQVGIYSSTVCELKDFTSPIKVDLQLAEILRQNSIEEQQQPQLNTIKSINEDRNTSSLIIHSNTDSHLLFSFPFHPTDPEFQNLFSSLFASTFTSQQQTSKYNAISEYSSEFVQAAPIFTYFSITVKLKKPLLKQDLENYINEQNRPQFNLSSFHDIIWTYVTLPSNLSMNTRNPISKRHLNSLSDAFSSLLAQQTLISLQQYQLTSQQSNINNSQQSTIDNQYPLFPPLRRVLRMFDRVIVSLFERVEQELEKERVIEQEVREQIEKEEKEQIRKQKRDQKMKRKEEMRLERIRNKQETSENQQMGIQIQQKEPEQQIQKDKWNYVGKSAKQQELIEPKQQNEQQLEIINNKQEESESESEDESEDEFQEVDENDPESIAEREEVRRFIQMHSDENGNLINKQSENENTQKENQNIKLNIQEQQTQIKDEKEEEKKKVSDSVIQHALSAFAPGRDREREEKERKKKENERSKLLEMTNSDVNKQRQQKQQGKKHGGKIVIKEKLFFGDEIMKGRKVMIREKEETREDRQRKLEEYMREELMIEQQEKLKELQKQRQQYIEQYGNINPISQQYPNPQIPFGFHPYNPSLQINAQFGIRPMITNPYQGIGLMRSYYNNSYFAIQQAMLLLMQTSPQLAMILSGQNTAVQPDELQQAFDQAEKDVDEKLQQDDKDELQKKETDQQAQEEEENDQDSNNQQITLERKNGLMNLKEFLQQQRKEARKNTVKLGQLKKELAEIQATNEQGIERSNNDDLEGTGKNEDIKKLVKAKLELKPIEYNPELPSLWDQSSKHGRRWKEKRNQKKELKIIDEKEDVQEQDKSEQTDNSNESSSSQSSSEDESEEDQSTESSDTSTDEEGQTHKHIHRKGFSKVGEDGVVVSRRKRDRGREMIHTQTSCSIELQELIMSGVAYAQVNTLCVVLQCTRCQECKDHAFAKIIRDSERDSEVIDNRNQDNQKQIEQTVISYSYTCHRCHSLLSAVFQPELIHQNNNVAGKFVSLSCCIPVDYLPSSSWMVTCGQCIRDVPFQRLALSASLSAASVTSRICLGCFSSVGLAFQGVEFIDNNTGLHYRRAMPSAGVDTTEGGQTANQRKSVQNAPLGFKLGTPLPKNGVCRHYKHSYRWLRFPCCGKVYPCDSCHDSDENHPATWASRMVCGFCSKEQGLTGAAANVGGSGITIQCKACGRNLTRGSTVTHWEGGRGCRDTTKMDRRDVKKYRDQNKTVSRKKQREQEKSSKKKK